MQDLHQVGVRPGDRFVVQQPLVFAGEGAVAGEILAMHQLHGAKGSHDVAGEPDGAIGTPPDAAYEVVIGNQGDG